MEFGDSGASRLIIDTNAVLKLLLFADAHMRPLREALERRQARWFSTQPMRDELAQVIARPALTRYSPDCERILTEFDQLSTRVLATDVIGSPNLACRDRDDQYFIDLAFHLRPATLITQDRDLLALARRALPLAVTITQRFVS